MRKQGKLAHFITGHGKTQLNRVCYFHFFGVFLAKDLIILTYSVSSLQLVLCRVAAIKRLPVHHHSSGYVFWSFGNTEFIFSVFENRVPLKAVLGGGGGVTNVAHVITGQEQAQLNRVCYFHFFSIFLASKASNYSVLILNSIALDFS